MPTLTTPRRGTTPPRPRTTRPARPPRDPDERMVWWMWTLTGFLALVLAVTVWLTWPVIEHRQPRALAFQDFDVCLLTDTDGITAEPAATTFAALKPTTQAKAARLSYLAITGEQTDQRAQQFITTLAQQGCDIIIGIGELAATAVTTTSPQHPDIDFFTIITTTEATTIANRVDPLIPTR